MDKLLLLPNAGFPNFNFQVCMHWNAPVLEARALIINLLLVRLRSVIVQGSVMKVKGPSKKKLNTIVELNTKATQLQRWHSMFLSSNLRHLICSFFLFIRATKSMLLSKLKKRTRHPSEDVITGSHKYVIVISLDSCL